MTLKINDCYTSYSKESRRRKNKLIQEIRNNDTKTVLSKIKIVIEFFKFLSVHPKKPQIPIECERYFKFTREKDLLYPEDNSDNYNFYDYINPIYLYFGVINLSILILSGFYSDWDQMHSLQLINWLSLIMLVVFIIQISALYGFGKTFKPINKIRLIFWTIVFLIFDLMIFSHKPINTPICSHFFDCPELPFFINISDLQILLAVVLSLSPLIIHILFIYKLYRLQGKIINYYVNNYTPPDSPKTKIPEF